MWIFPQMVCHARFRNPCLPTLQNFLPPKKTWFLNKLTQIHNVWKSLKNSHFSTSRESKIHFSILNSHFSNCQNSHFRKITLFFLNSHIQVIFKHYSKITSGIIWIIAVAKRTPPPKHKRTEVTVRFQALSSLTKYFPIFKGINPKIREMPPKSTMAKYLVPSKSILSAWFYKSEW